MKPIIALAILILNFTAFGQIRFYESNVVVQTFVGSGFYGHLNGTGEETMFYSPTALCFDASTNMYICDSGNRHIRMVTPQAEVTTIYNQPAYEISSMVDIQWLPNRLVIANGGAALKSMALSTDYFSTYNSGIYGYLEGHISNSRFSSIPSMCRHPVAELIIADQSNYRVRMLTNTFTGVLAGSGNSGGVDGVGIFTSWHTMTAVAANQAGDVFVAEGTQIRRINYQSRAVTTIIGSRNSGYVDAFGTNALFSEIAAMDVTADGSLVLVDQGNHAIRKVNMSDLRVTTIAGGSGFGFLNGSGQSAKFNNPSDVVALGGDVYVADRGNHRIRKITTPVETTVTNSNLSISSFAGVRISGSVGRAYRIESSVDSSTWATNSTFTLPSNPYLWIDTNAIPNNPRKFYRAVLLP